MSFFHAKIQKLSGGFSSFWSICCLFFFYTGASVRSAWALTRDRKAVCGKPVGTSLFQSSLASARSARPLTRDAKVGAPWQVGLTASFAFRCRPLTHLVRPCNAWPIAWPILLPIAWPSVTYYLTCYSVSYTLGWLIPWPIARPILFRAVCSFWYVFCHYEMKWNKMMKQIVGLPNLAANTPIR